MEQSKRSILEKYNPLAEPMTPGLYTPQTTGTTIMAVAYDGGVLMGADSRTTYGTLVSNRVTDKLEPIHKRIYCLRSGVSSHTQALARYVRYGLQMHSVQLGSLPLVQTAAHLFRQYVYQYKDQLGAAIIVGGWDEKEGGCVYQIPLGGSLFKVGIAVGGSGSTFIQGFIDANYKEGKTKAELKEFVKHAISLAMFRDGSSGGCVRIVDINKDGVHKEYFPHEDLPIS